MVPRSNASGRIGAHLTPFGQGREPQAYGAKRICFIFNGCTLAAPWKLTALNEARWLACIIFLKRKCATSLGQLKKFWARALPLQKNVTFLRGHFSSEEKLLPQTASRGGAAPQRWQKKYWRWIVRWKILFLSRWHVRLRGRAERSVGGTLDHLHKTFYRSTGALACVGSRGYLT